MSASKYGVNSVRDPPFERSEFDTGSSIAPSGLKTAAGGGSCDAYAAARLAGIVSLQNELVPASGVEPPRPCGHEILSLARMPISPRRAFAFDEFSHVPSPVQGPRNIAREHVSSEALVGLDKCLATGSRRRDECPRPCERRSFRAAQQRRPFRPSIRACLDLRPSARTLRHRPRLP